MKKLIPLEVSSSLSAISADRPLEVTPYANATGVTTEKAPVLISVRSESSVDAEQFAERMRAVGGQGTSAQARLALNAVAVVLGELVEEYGAVTVQTPFGTVQTFIAGTLENATDAPDPETNFAFLGVVVPEAYRRQFAKMSAYIPADACPAALKRVRDKATNRQGIAGTAPFYLEGRGMTIGGEGETLELLDPVTRDVICAVSVDAGSKSPVQFLCTLAPQTALEAGTYLLRLVTLAGGEAALWPVELKVELLEAVAPKPRVTIGSLAAVMEDADNARITLDNLANFEAIRGYAENPGGTPTFTAKLYRNGTYLKDVTFNVYDPDIKGLSECETTGFTPDEELKVVLEVDPEKTEYDPTPAEATCTVTA